MPSGFHFANPTYTADDSGHFSAVEINADKDIKKEQEIQHLEPIPKPRIKNLVMDLGSVLPESSIDEITESGQMVFHCVGDTGGIEESEPQLAVADAMVADLSARSGFDQGQPAFFYHLGDVVYFFGQERYYPEQFYEPYRNYDAPIFAIPGNHDGFMYKGEQVQYSLQPFVQNFCSASPAAGVPGYARTTMTQPAVYFTLTAPFVRIIGLYSNVGETTGVIAGTKVGNAQLNFLTSQLEAALDARNNDPKNPEALILAVHHPPFTGSSAHSPSPGMLRQIDKCCTQAKIWPDLVLSGHAHLYEHYTRTTKAGLEIPYLVSGNGGYYNLPGIKKKKNNKKPVAGKQKESDGQGGSLTLDAYNDTQYGFMRITVNATSISVQSIVVTSTAQRPSAAPPPTKIIDSFTIKLNR
jgi:hypothetical protein